MHSVGVVFAPVSTLPFHLFKNHLAKQSGIFLHDDHHVGGTQQQDKDRAHLSAHLCP